MLLCVILIICIILKNLSSLNTEKDG